MQYIVTDKLVDGYWFGKYPTLELARREAVKFSGAVHIMEYRDAYTKPAGIVPTGVSYPIVADLPAPALNTDLKDAIFLELKSKVTNEGEQ